MIPHDVIHLVFNNMKNAVCEGDGIHLGCIEIMDNCFIGSYSIILPDVKIGPNSIVAAGSVVTKDVPEGSILGENPAKIIGSTKDLMDKRRGDIGVTNIKLDWAEDLWRKFNEKYSRKFCNIEES